MSGARYIDTTYMPGIPASGQIPGGAGMRRRRATTQAGGLKFKDITNGIGKAIKWVKENKPITKLDEFLDKNAPAGLAANPIYNGFRQVTKAGKSMGLGEVHIHHHHARKPAGGKRKRKATHK